MYTIVDRESKIVEVWLEKSEQMDAAVQQQITMWRNRRYQVVLYRSGTADLYSNTAALLTHNAQCAQRTSDVDARARA